MKRCIPSPTMSEQEDPSWLENTTLMATWRSMKEEILRHKWLESEKEGSDIGWERAFVNWMAHHRIGFERARRSVEEAESGRGIP